jgi:hypothetical protein
MPLPLLETLSKIFNGNAVNGRQRFSLNLCHISKMPTFQILIRPWEKNKITRSEIGRLGGGGRKSKPLFCFWVKMVVFG